jgi:hypothetical protein
MITQENARWLSPNCPQNFPHCLTDDQGRGGVARGWQGDLSQPIRSHENFWQKGNFGCIMSLVQIQRTTSAAWLTLATLSSQNVLSRLFGADALHQTCLD